MKILGEQLYPIFSNVNGQRVDMGQSGLAYLSHLYLTLYTSSTINEGDHAGMLDK